MRSAGGGQSGSDLWTDQSWQVQAERRIGEALLPTGTRQLGEKALDLPESVGPHAPREQPQGIAAVALQLAGAPQANGP